MLWSNSLSTANKKLWIWTSDMKEERAQSQLFVPCWYSLDCISPDTLTSQSFSSSLHLTPLWSLASPHWGMSYINPFGRWSACHCTALTQPFQGCPLLPLAIKPSVMTRKAYTGPKFNSVKKSKFNHEISVFFPSMCWETALEFRSRAESFRSRQVAPLSLANAFYLKINK